jgi:TrmH family RNA methyltransferase
MDGLIAIEGPKLLEEALRSGLRLHSVFFREDKSETLQDLVPALQELAHQSAAPPQFQVAADAFNHACATDSPQGVAALVEAPRWSLERLLKADRPLLLVLAGLQDPGNLGAILRAAEAFGASGILLSPGTVSPWNQKVLRASAGSSFRLPVAPLHDIEMLRLLQDREIPLYACVAQHGTPAAEANLYDRVALVIGNEGAGIPDEVLAHCSGNVHIPCPGPVESLNAAVAASIFLYEASRQRACAPVKATP